MGENSKVATKGLDSFEPMKVARWLDEEVLCAEPGVRGLWKKGSDWYRWHADKKWVLMTGEDVRDLLWESLEDAVKKVQDAEGGLTITRLKPDRAAVGNILEALGSAAKYGEHPIPKWMVPGMPDASHCVAFLDVVVDVKGTAERYRETGEYEWVTVERDARFFSTGVVGVKFEEGVAGCPTWVKSMEEWSQGDAVWMELRERMYGYAMMATRKYAKWMLEYGKVRSGKGMGVRVLEKLLPESAILGKTMDQLAGDFGLDGVDTAQVLVVNEANELGWRQAAKLSSLLKVMVGGDRGEVNAKNLRQKQNVRLDVLPIVQSNEMVQLPNTGRGVSSKMIPLNFDVSFEGREDAELEWKLAAELPGIARRFLEAAVRLEAETEIAKKFVVPERAQRVKESFDAVNNPFDAFLQGRFVKAVSGRVSNEKVRAERIAWEEETGLVLETQRGGRVSEKGLTKALLEQSSWDLKPVRWKKKEVDGFTEVRGLQGLMLRPRKNEEWWV